jgi:hypothetical protein
VDKQQKQTILDLPKVIAVGISSPVAAVLTSRFGIAGTLIGLALSAVLLTALVDILKVYLARTPAAVARVPGTVAKMPGGLRTRLSWHAIRGRLRTAFAKSSSLPATAARRRSVLIGSVLAAGISFLVGLSIVTGLELGADNNLSCWVWKECYTESSSNGEASSSSTLPSILGGGQSASSNTPQVNPVGPQQQMPPGSRGSSSQPPGVPGSEIPTPPTSSQRWSPSGVPVSEDQRQSFSGVSEEEQRPSGSSAEEDQKQSIDQQRSAGSSEDQQQKARNQEIPTPPPFST